MLFPNKHLPGNSSPNNVNIKFTKTEVKRKEDWSFARGHSRYEGQKVISDLPNDINPDVSSKISEICLNSQSHNS